MMDASFEPMGPDDPLPPGHDSGTRVEVDGDVSPFPEIPLGQPFATVMPTLLGWPNGLARREHCTTCNASVWVSWRSQLPYRVCYDCMDERLPGWRTP